MQVVRIMLVWRKLLGLREAGENIEGIDGGLDE
jgi:hypothetical protein